MFQKGQWAQNSIKTITQILREKKKKSHITILVDPCRHPKEGLF